MHAVKKTLLIILLISIAQLAHSQTGWMDNKTLLNWGAKAATVGGVCYGSYKNNTMAV